VSTQPYEPEEVLPWRPVRIPKSMPADPLEGAKPKVYKVAGHPRSFYGIGVLAQALNRKPGTIRKWEVFGWIPKPTAVFPGRDPRDSASARHGRRRLYTAAQIRGLVKIAYEEGVLEPHARPIQETNFPQRAHRLFSDLAVKEREEIMRLRSQAA